MYQIDNERIGDYLAGLIKNGVYKNARQFCIAYLKLRDGEEPEKENIDKMQNRISQIKLGKKGLQLEDIPVITQLLGVSAETLLSAGTHPAPVSDRVTNYSVALSDDPAQWEAYVKREDRPILNPDEYNKTVVEYAFEAGNYRLLKYLMDEKYIWLVDESKDGGYYMGFGAGTSIKKRDCFHMDDGLTSWLSQKDSEDELRFRMISLAIENKDCDMLTRLRARELPMLYTAIHWPNTLKKQALPRSEYTERMVERIALGGGEVLSYFFERFKIRPVYGKCANTYIFPYAGEVLDVLIKRRRKEAAGCLKAALEHNGAVRRELRASVEKTVEACKNNCRGMNDFNRDDCVHRALKEGWCSAVRENGLVAYAAPPCVEELRGSGFVSNCIRVSAKSAEPAVQRLIDELNGIYDEIFGQIGKGGILRARSDL